ncbi:MAG: hypothetical protein NC820_08075 [Candidatus Omnitrophica bacterium]|nr:hypothetical protein [Candidatus Omnitrophota bacterium]
MGKKVGIVIHPIERGLLYDYEPGMKRFSIDVAKKILQWMSPFKASTIEGIRSALTGEEFYGELIMCPLLMEQMVSLSPRKVLNRVVKAARLAKDRGANMVALVGYSGLVGMGGMKVYENVKIPLTIGMHMTIAIAPQTIIKAVNFLGYRHRRLKVFIFGVNIFTEMVIHKLERLVNEFYLCHTSLDRKIDFYNYLPENLKKKIKIVHDDPLIFIKEMDIVINFTSKKPLGFDENYLKKGAIVFDASYPRDIVISRDDVLLTDGLVLRPPGEPKFNFNFGLEEGFCFPCMAEPITLYFENRFESYSLDKDFSIERAEAIYNLALKHGFKLGHLTSYEKIIPPQKIEAVRKNLARKSFFFSRLRGKN